MRRYLFSLVVLVLGVTTVAADEPKPLRVGIIGLDTSHVTAFTGLLNRDKQKPELAGVRVVAAFPAGSKDVEASYTRVKGFTDTLKDKHGVEIVDSIDALLPKVDVILLESVDGRPHLEQVKPVLKAGKPVFIDKPVAGSLADAIRIYDLAKEAKVPVFSSSSLRFAPEILAARTPELVGCMVYSPCSLEPHHPDLFWYGVHGVEMLFALMGTGCETVTRTQTKDTEIVTGVWKDGRVATFRGIRSGKSEYGMVTFGTKGIVAQKVSTGYEPLVVEIVKFFRTGKPPVSAEETVEMFAFMEAADESKRRGGAPVKLAEVIDKARADRGAKPAWDTEVEKALSQAGDNRVELEKALNGAPGDQRKGMAFLIANMPRTDLLSLKADFLLENVDLAYKARKQVPWGEKIPEDIFLNDVLPYANVDEARHAWRKELYEMCLPLVKDCKTPAEAAQVLNSKLFAIVKVKYSTQRKLPNQSPKESIEQGLASCTGLSIILSDACRSVGVPARLVGTPLWSNKRGNHTWVEIWDGRWHFTGACEADPKGLDRGWFVGEAAKAQKDKPLHAIYAASFRKTETHFPLVWAPGSKDVPAENVTDHYARTETSTDKSKLTAEQLKDIEKEATAYFTATDEQRAKWSSPEKFDQWLADDDAAVRRAVWNAYKAGSIHAAMKRDFDDKVVRTKTHLSPYTVKQVGKRPEKGWPLVIAMHGGGGVPKQINDQQWEHMQIYYKDQASVTGYQYLALRAPNDVWNGFYDDYVPPLVINLIRQFALFGDIDPDKVYLIGYSHGGYGAFFIGPKIPDRFAAIHCSASAPTDGTISPLSLRNTRFTFMVGEKDSAYGRRDRCEKFAETIKKLKEQDKNDFPVEFEFKPGFGHGGLPDRDKIKDLYPYTRNAVPHRLTWEPTDSHITDFFWITVPQPAKGQSVDVTLRDNAAQITTKNVKQLVLNLDARQVVFSKPLIVTLDGQVTKWALRPRFVTLCQSLMRRGDPVLAFTCQVVLEAEKK